MEDNGRSEVNATDPDPNPSEETSTGLDPRLAGLLSYLLGFLSGIIFLVVERKNSFVRFHAMQSTVTFIGLLAASIVAGIIPVLGPILAWLVQILTLVLWILLMVKAFQGETYKLPVIGDMAEERARIRSG
jgi:uncharacterized membrane protein